MSHQIKFVAKVSIFLERLQTRINKGLGTYLVTMDIMKEIKVDSNAREVKIEIPITFEIKEEVKAVPITFAIKEEVEKLVIKIVQKTKFNYHIKVSLRIHNRVFKLLLLSLGSTIIIPTNAIMF
jgi:hypothetical protein